MDFNPWDSDDDGGGDDEGPLGLPAVPQGAGRTCADYAEPAPPFDVSNADPQEASPLFLLPAELRVRLVGFLGPRTSLRHAAWDAGILFRTCKSLAAMGHDEAARAEFLLGNFGADEAVQGFGAYLKLASPKLFLAVAWRAGTVPRYQLQRLLRRLVYAGRFDLQPAVAAFLAEAYPPAPGQRDLPAPVRVMADDELFRALATQSLLPPAYLVQEGVRGGWAVEADPAFTAMRTLQQRYGVPAISGPGAKSEASRTVHKGWDTYRDVGAGQWAVSEDVVVHGLDANYALLLRLISKHDRAGVRRLLDLGVATSPDQYRRGWFWDTARKMGLWDPSLDDLDRDEEEFPRPRQIRQNIPPYFPFGGPDPEEWYGDAHLGHPSELGSDHGSFTMDGALGAFYGAMPPPPPPVIPPPAPPPQGRADPDPETCLEWLLGFPPARDLLGPLLPRPSPALSGAAVERLLSAFHQFVPAGLSAGGDAVGAAVAAGDAEMLRMLLLHEHETRDRWSTLAGRASLKWSMARAENRLALYNLLRGYAGPAEEGPMDLLAALTEGDEAKAERLVAKGIVLSPQKLIPLLLDDSLAASHALAIRLIPIPAKELEYALAMLLTCTHYVAAPGPEAHPVAAQLLAARSDLWSTADGRSMLLRLWAGTGLGTLAGCAKGILRPYLGPGSEYEVTLPRSVGTSLLEWDLQDAVVKGNVELARSLVARGVRTRVTSSLGLSGEEISPDMLEFLVANDLAAASLLLKLCVRQGLLALARRVIEANADRVDPFEVLPVAIPSVPPPAEKQDEVLELFKCALREVPAARYIASTLVSQAAQAGEEFKAALQEYLDEIEAQGLALPVTPMGMASAVQHFNFANY